MDIYSLFWLTTGIFIGAGWRFVYEFAVHNVQRTGKPLRAINVREETRVFSQSVDASIEPNHIPLMWKSRMRAFVFHSETCTTPANARQLKERIGLDRPRQMAYLNLLIDAGIIRVKARETSVWLTDWHTRHKAIASLPYPRNVEPPDFITRKGVTDSTDSVQNRQNTGRITA